MKHLPCLLVCWLTLWGGTAFAQLQKLPSAVAREIYASALSRTALERAALRGVAAQRMQHLKQLEKTKFAELDAVLSTYFLPDTRVANARMLAENEALKEKMVRRWVEQDFYAFQQAEPLRNRVVYRAEQNPDYTSFMPSSAKLILVGESHYQQLVIDEVITLLYQLQDRYPGRPIYYASEFIYANPSVGMQVLRTPSEIERYTAGNLFYWEASGRAFDTGVNVVGLEDPELLYSRNLSPNETPFLESEQAWKSISPAGVRERNAFWTEIIRDIYEEAPDALVVVHAGSGHTNYTQLNALPFMLKDLKPFVINFGQAAPPAFKRYFPFPPEVLQKGKKMQRKDPYQTVRYVRFFPSKRGALVTGCDLHVELSRRK